jgi:uncharacterized membrane protein YeiH
MFQFLDIIGTMAFMSGALTAMNKNGSFGCLSSLCNSGGGGTLRDILIVVNARMDARFNLRLCNHHRICIGHYF